MDRKKLDIFHKLISETILANQNVVTGLIPASPSNLHAWVRDNTYAVLCVWGLSLAYRKVPDVDEDRTRGYELEMCVVKLMRGILTCFMRQANRVQNFKITQRPSDALHAKFDSRTCNSVVGDYDWGHLQIDAVSLFLLTMAQITASGVRLIWTPTEVLFVQNLIFYIEFAYRTPDYGIWERGDKTNHGMPEINSSSVGMAKAALEAMNELDLYGSHGGPESTVHVLLDESQQCAALLESVLPRESCSKETDSALLSIISYPAFAVDDEALVELTRNTIRTKLQGRYGCKRFMRDGYRTPIEDASRLHYEPWELRQFESIECEWPLFFCYLVLDAQFRGDHEEEELYWQKLESVLIHQPAPGGSSPEETVPLVPESYTLPYWSVEAERANPGSQKREAVGKLPHIWGQSLYLLARMIHEGVLLPGEIDPLGRRMITTPRPDLVVQVCAVAENESIRDRLSHYQIHVPTFTEINKESAIKIFPAKLLTHLYKHLGHCRQLNLKGREDKEVGVLTTSRMYRVGDQTVVFVPQFVDAQVFYLGLDFEFTVDTYRTCMAFLRRNWLNSGRPLLILPIYDCHFPTSGAGPFERSQPALVTMLKKMQSGLINGTRVLLDRLERFTNTSCTTRISFVRSMDDFYQKVDKHVVNLSSSGSFRHRLGSRASGESVSNWRRGVSASGMPGGGGGMPHAPHNRQALSQHGYPPPGHTFMRRQSVALTSAVSIDLGSDDESVREHELNSLQTPHSNMVTPGSGPSHSRARNGGHTAGRRHYLWETDEEEEKELAGGDSLLREANAFGMFALGANNSPASGGKGSMNHSPLVPFHDLTKDDWEGHNTPRLKTPDTLPHAKSTDSMYLRRLITSHTHLNQLSHNPGSSPVTTPTIYSKPTFEDSGMSHGGEMDLSPEQKEANFRKNLVERLLASEDLFEQVELVYNLYVLCGFMWDTQIDSEGECTVKDLVKELYDRAGQLHQWWVVRFTAGLLRKRPEHLARALADILVLQKQVTVGLPPEPRERVISTPLPPTELEAIVHTSCEQDHCMAMLTQEILIYLSMFSRSEPRLLHSMLRLRIGLIIQVMASELGRSLHCTAEEASMALFNVSPYQVKTLLHHILSGKEFEVQNDASHPCLSNPNRAGLFGVHSLSRRYSRHRLTRFRSRPGGVFSPDQNLQPSSGFLTVPNDEVAWSLRSDSTAGAIEGDISAQTMSPMASMKGTPAAATSGHEESQRRGQWLRRRKIDGSLNRVPQGFYEQLWHVLERSITVYVGSFALNEGLTREMTEGETKFALRVESTMNTVPVPEYRQLLVECLSVLNTIVTLDKSRMINLQPHLRVEDVLLKAHEQFLEDQRHYSGDATICCASSQPGGGTPCRGACGICAHFYDTSPSGRYGTMTYIVRALSEFTTLPLNNDGAYELTNCALQ